MKKLLFLFAIVALLGACCNSNKTNTETAIANSKECASITIDSFLVIAPDYIGKELTVKGTADHVCKHGGKRVKLLSTESGETIHGEASEDMGAFNAEIEGNSVCLTGKVLETKIDMAYVDEWEAGIKEAMEKEFDEADMEHKEGVDHHAKLDEINEYRKQIEASENGYISFYALDVVSYHMCDSTKEVDCKHMHKTANDTTGSKKDTVKD